MNTRELVTVAILSSLGAVLMILELPYPIIPFLAIDLSDIVVLIAFSIYGWKHAGIVGVLKVVVHALFKGPVGPAYIGQITAFLASMSYVLGMFILKDKLNLKNVVSAIGTVLIVTFILTLGNYLFITPIWFGGTTFLDVQAWVTPEAFGLNANGGYLAAIIFAYVPFNLIKGAIIVTAYFVIERAIGSRLQELK